MFQLKSSQNLIAYFSMEIGIDPQILTYSGGLGILAGDTLRSFADLSVPAVGITLISEYGYLNQHISSQNQQDDSFERWQIERYLDSLAQEVIIRADNSDIYLKLWRYTVTGLSGHQVPIIFLDANHPQNKPEHRKLTQRLYPSNPSFRILQEIILGIGGVKALSVLGFQPSVYHLNEGHPAFLTLELLKQAKLRNEPDPIKYVRNHCVFTTHTPVESGHDKFEAEFVKTKLDEFDLLSEVPNAIDQEDQLNMTLLALAMSERINGVAKKHAEVSRMMFPNFMINSVTNGVHHGFWTTPSFHMLYTEYLPGWNEDPFSLRGALKIPRELIKEAHNENKHRLFEHIYKTQNVSYDPSVFTIGYARRITKYKRPDLIFYDLNRLIQIAQKYPIQLVFAGKAHHEDTVGKSLINEILNLIPKIKPQIRLVFLPNYDINQAKLIIPGVDIWLNTPKRPLEASGTSGMKASLNGVPNLSVLDGWWLEGAIEGITGWSVGPYPHDHEKISDLDCIDSDDSEDLYRKLEQIILPMYYERNDEYNSVRRYGISLIGSHFNSHRMVQEYILKSYLT
ncbi:alpha-glucan family phosphorylase [candidate division WWE3 bacterium]|nr:alpha-glucan family phosphorylase [candidate division WWE3 bacterium]